MAYCNNEMEYNDVTETLANTFGAVLGRDVIFAIVESCSGDLNQAANAIMLITSEDQTDSISAQNTPDPQTSKNESRRNGRPVTKKSPRNNKNGSKVPPATSGPNTLNPNANQITSNQSYASVSSRNRSAIPKPPKPLSQTPEICLTGYNLWSDQIKRIVTYHNQGARTLIIMRGAPGSGKSCLARQILEITIGARIEQQHIFSADDFFYTDGVYRFDKFKLQEAHKWNQTGAFDALDKGISPIIIDNTNVDYWEIAPYVRTGVYNGYYLEVVEPSTPWARNMNQLASRNIHGVPPGTIKRMLETITTLQITSITLMTTLQLAYPVNMKPPVLRCLPPFIPAHKDKNSKKTVTQVLKNESNKFFSVFEKLESESSTQETNVVNSTEPTLRQNSNDEVSISTTIHSVEEDKNSFAHINVVELSKELKMCDQGVNSDIKDEQVLSDKVEHLTISKEENEKSQYKDQDEFEIQTEITQEANNEPQNYQNYNNVTQASTDNITQARTDNIEDNLILIENGNSTNLREEQLNFEKQLEEFQKVENEWDNGEAWEEDGKGIPTATESKISSEAKPPRKRKPQDKDDSLPTYTDDNDWKKISMFMPSWSDNDNLSLEPSKNVVETKSTETCMEIGDTEISNINNKYKIISAVARDININYIPDCNEKIPENRMLDKSSMTTEPTSIVGAYRCKNEAKHFIRFRNMFKNLNKDDLKDIFDKCCGDVNWAVSIVLDDMANKEIKCIAEDEYSDTEDENDEPCECTAHYDIIPDTTPSVTEGRVDENIPDVMPSTSRGNDSLNLNRKQKKDSPLSDTSLALKRQIEQNIVISDQFYSQECLKVRKLRHGELDGDVSSRQITDITNGIQNLDNSDYTEVSNNGGLNRVVVDKDSALSTLEVADTECESDDESAVIFNDVEKTVNVNLGREFLSQLDTLFGRGDMIYSDNIEPRINMPISILNEINALWMESLMYQLEAESKSHEELIKQDEQLAREIAMKQAEISQTGKEPEVPDFKEIMDMEFALSLYHKDCNKWKKEKPTDLAAMLSAQKLHNLFPEIPPEDLDEIHNAHNYDFQNTVRVVLIATERRHIVEEQNGINRFVMSEELKRQERFLAEEKQRLNDMMKWPALPSQISLDIVGQYRQLATAHLEKRLISYVKAADFLNQGLPTIANYYSDIATFHTLKYEQAQSVAAATLMQFHASNGQSATTLDLHYLRVNEAKEALDMFLDSHIQHLKERNSRKNVTLFFITGRGLHSQGGPKIKPAVKKRLIERHLGFNERNPGLLTSKVTAGDILSYQIA